MATRYRRVIYRVPAALEEVLTAELWCRGTLGVEVRAAAPGELVLEAWFPADGATLGDGEAAAFPGARLVATEEVAARDWLADYREAARPFALGEGFWVDPREPEGEPSPAPPGRWLLRLPARSAFGTGSHESTRLALELLEATPPAGGAVLDVGAGSGILAFAALLLGARRAVGLDVDPGSAVIAAHNARLNRAVLGPRPPVSFYAGRAVALGPPARFDLALVNVLPERILAELGTVVALLAPGGGLIFSGLLAGQGEAALGRLAALGLVPVAERRAGEWVAYRLERGGEGAR